MKKDRRSNYVAVLAVKAALLAAWLLTRDPFLQGFVIGFYWLLAVLNLLSIVGLCAYHAEGEREKVRNGINGDLHWFSCVAQFGALAYGGAMITATVYFAAVVARDVSARLMVEDYDV